MSSQDPLSQNVTIIDVHGVAWNQTIAEIDSLAFYELATVFNYGIQIGLIITTLVVTLSMTASKKRRKPIFLLNTLTLVVAFVSRILLAVFFETAFVSLYATQTGDESLVPGWIRATSIASDIFPVLLTLLINTSLVFQAKAVMLEESRFVRFFLMTVSCLVFLIALGFRTYECYLNIVATLGEVPPDFAGFVKGALGVEIISIWWFALIFNYKLFRSIMFRRHANIKGWGILHILFIGSFCTMIIPGNSLTLSSI
jgi:pheromone alpha factor receptor